MSPQCVTSGCPTSGFAGKSYKYCFCSSTYVSAFGFVGFILFNLGNIWYSWYDAETCCILRFPYDRKLFVDDLLIETENWNRWSTVGAWTYSYRYFGSFGSKATDSWQSPVLRSRIGWILPMMRVCWGCPKSTQEYQVTGLLCLAAVKQWWQFLHVLYIMDIGLVVGKFYVGNHAFDQQKTECFLWSFPLGPLVRRRLAEQRSHCQTHRSSRGTWTPVLS